eukprot:2490036-Rhodomonas_salina.1
MEDGGGRCGEGAGAGHTEGREQTFSGPRVVRAGLMKERRIAEKPEKSVRKRERARQTDRQRKRGQRRRQARRWEREKREGQRQEGRKQERCGMKEVSHPNSPFKSKTKNIPREQHACAVGAVITTRVHVGSHTAKTAFLVRRRKREGREALVTCVRFSTTKGNIEVEKKSSARLGNSRKKKVQALRNRTAQSAPAQA